MKIIIGGRDIEVPRFMAEALKKPENGRQFHAFLRQALAAQADKARGGTRLSPLEELDKLVSVFKRKR